MVKYLCEHLQEEGAGMSNIINCGGGGGFKPKLIQKSGTSWTAPKDMTVIIKFEWPGPGAYTYFNQYLSGTYTVLGEDGYKLGTVSAFASVGCSDIVIASV